MSHSAIRAVVAGFGPVVRDQINEAVSKALASMSARNETLEARVIELEARLAAAPVPKLVRPVPLVRRGRPVLLASAARPVIRGQPVR